MQPGGGGPIKGANTSFLTIARKRKGLIAPEKLWRSASFLPSPRGGGGLAKREKRR